MKVKVKLGLKMLFAVCFIGVFSSCSSDDGGSGDTNIPGYELKSYKYTITVNGAIDDLDYFSFTVAGGAGSVGDTSLWKVNGEVRTGENALGLTEDDFKGATKTYVVESTQPLLTAPCGVSVVNTEQPFSFSFKAEVDGETKLDESFTVEDESFLRDYNF